MQIQQYKTVNVGIGRRRLFRVGNVVTIWIRIGSPALMASWFCGPAIRHQRVLKSQQMTFKTSNAIYCYCYLFFRQLPQHQRSVMAAHRNDVPVVVKEPGARYGTAVYFFLVVFGFTAQTRVPDGKMSTNWRLTRLFLVTWIVWDIRQCRRLLINRGRLNDKRYWSVTW